MAGQQPAATADPGYGQLGITQGQGFFGPGQLANINAQQALANQQDYNIFGSFTTSGGLSNANAIFTPTVNTFTTHAVTISPYPSSGITYIPGVFNYEMLGPAQVQIGAPPAPAPKPKLETTELPGKRSILLDKEI